MAKKNILTFLILFSVSNLCLAECDKVGSTDVLDATVQENPFNSSEGRTDNCQEIPDFYKVTFYKIALCRSNPYNDSNDFSSCEYIVNASSGIPSEMTYAASRPLAVGDFTISQGDYPYAMLILDNRIYIKHTQQYDEDITGYSASASDAAAKGTFCSTNEQVTTIDNFQGTLPYITTTEASGDDQRLIGMVCSDSAGTAEYASEIIDNICHVEDECGNTSSLTTNFNAVAPDSELNASQTGGISNIKLLQIDNATTATSRGNARRILYTIAFTSPVNVTGENDQYDIAFNISGSVSVDHTFANDKIYAQKVGAEMFTAIFTVTNTP